MSSIGSEYYQSVGFRGLFVAPRGFTSKEHQLFVDDGDSLAEYKVTRAGGGFDVGYNFKPFSEIRTGIEVARLRGEVQIGLPVLPSVRGMKHIWTNRWRFNALKSGTVPTNGLLADSQLNWQFKSPDVYFLGQPATEPDSYGQAWSQIIYARPLSEKWAGVARILGRGGVTGRHFGFGWATILRRVYTSPTSAVSKVYGMLPYEVGDAFDSRPSLFHSGTTGITAETRLGVLSMGFSYGEQGRRALFFSVGGIFDVGVRDSLRLR